MRPGLAAIALVACTRKEPPVATADAAAPLVVTPVVDAAVAPAVVDAAPARRSLAGKKVLHVGDSMVGGNFGLTKALEKKLAAEGAKLVRHTQVSETLVTFDKGSTLRDLIRTNEPDIVIITLGMNDATVPHPEAFAKNVQNIVRHVGERECWWLGPPRSLAPDAAASTLPKVLAENTGACHFFDATDLELERTSDGIHPTNEGGARWADAFWQVFDPQ